MCMQWLKYVRLDRKDRLENMRGTTLKVAMLTDVSRVYSVISNVYQCVTGPLGPLVVYIDLLCINFES